MEITKYLPLLIFTLFSAILSWTDYRTKRLPNSWVLATSISTFISILITRNFGQVIPSIIIASGYFAIFLVIAILSRNSLGFGDVKYAFSCGLIVGFYTPNIWLFGIWLMFVVAGIFQLPKLVGKRIRLKDRIAFGPYMAISTIAIALNSLTKG